MFTEHTFQQGVIQTFQNIQTQIQDINDSLRQIHETQQKIQETMAALVTKISELDNRVSATEESKFARSLRITRLEKQGWKRCSKVISNNSQKNRNKSKQEYKLKIWQ